MSISIRVYILFKHPSRAENSGNLLCYKPLAVLSIQRDNTEKLIGTHQSQSACNSTGVFSSQLLFKLPNNGDNIVLQLRYCFSPLRVIFINWLSGCKVSILLCGNKCEEVTFSALPTWMGGNLWRLEICQGIAYTDGWFFQIILLT